MSALTKAAGLIVYRHCNASVEYLLLQASNAEPHWSPPKGHVDPGETNMETALRETQEETGIPPADLTVKQGFEKVLRYKAFGRNKMVTYWLAQLLTDRDIVISHEHEAYCWQKVEEACKLVGYQDMQETLKECETFLYKK